MRRGMRISSRPIGVIVIAVLMVLTGAAVLVALVPLMRQGVPPAALVINALFAVGLVYVAWGLFKLRSWAWLSTLLIVGINAAFSIVDVARAPARPLAWAPLVVAAVVGVYLSRRRIRAAFGVARPPA